MIKATRPPLNIKPKFERESFFLILDGIPIVSQDKCYEVKNYIHRNLFVNFMAMEIRIPVGADGMTLGCAMIECFSRTHAEYARENFNGLTSKHGVTLICAF